MDAGSRGLGRFLATDWTLFKTAHLGGTLEMHAAESQEKEGHYGCERVSRVRAETRRRCRWKGYGVVSPVVSVDDLHENDGRRLERTNLPRTTLLFHTPGARVH